jgi:WD40 repeat protein
MTPNYLSIFALLKGNSMFHTKILKSTLFLIVISLLLCACAGMATTPTSTPKPQVKETVLPPTLVPTDIPTSIASPRPSSTPAPPKPSKTPDFKATEIAQFPIQCTNFNTFDGAVISPNGNWLAVTCGDNHDQTLEIVNHSGQRWVLQFKDYILPEYVSDNHANTDGNLYPVHWSGDDGFLYFVAYVAYDEGGACFFGYGVHGLFRMDLRDGKVSTILSPVSAIDKYHLTFSPTGRRLAYQKDVSSPFILDLQTGQQTAILIKKDEYAGGLVWSDNGLQLAYATCKVNRITYTEEKSAIMIYSVQENTSKTVLES